MRIGNAVRNPHTWFVALLIVGIGICLPKLLRPMRIEKKSYKMATQWLKENTKENDLIASSDPRIGFYAGRPTIKIVEGKIPRKTSYIVKIVKNSGRKINTTLSLRQEYSLCIDQKNKKRRIIIYKVM